MDYELNVPERLMLLGLLPQQGSVAFLKVLHEARIAMSLNEKEIKDFEVSGDDKGNIRWNVKGNEKKVIKLGDVARRLIAKQILELDKKDAITAQMLPVVELILKEDETKQLKEVK